MKLITRSAKQEEMDWINGEYQKIHFPLSNFDNELIVIAELKGERVGLGRLITVDPQHGEIGGIYVLEEHRGQGIARQITNHLIEASKRFEKTFLFSYERSHPHYKKFGFELTPEDEIAAAPQYIVNKLKWCNDEYDEVVLLQELSHQ